MSDAIPLASLSVCPCVVEVLTATTAACLLAGVVAWKSWRASAGEVGRWLTLTTLCLVGGLGLWLGIAVLATLADIPVQLWATPLDRLVGTAILAGLTWTLVAPGGDRHRWGAALIVLVVGTMAMYLFAAPAWARAHVESATAVPSPGVIEAWEGVELALAVVLLRNLRGRGAPAWVAALVATLAVGSLLQIVLPTGDAVPVWSNTGTVLAGCLVASVVALHGRVSRPAGWPSPAAFGWRGRRGGGSQPALPSMGGPAVRAASGMEERVLRADEACWLGDPRAGQAVLPGGPGSCAPVEPPPEAAIAALSAPLEVPGDELAPAAGHAPMGEWAGQALDWLPIGVMITDAEDRIVAVNRAAERLLHCEGLRAGSPAVDAFPSRDRAELAMYRTRHSYATGTGPVLTAFDSPSVRTESAPLGQPETGYTGAVIVVYPSTSSTGDIAPGLVPALATALRAPMASVLGYCELLGRMSGLSADQIDRYVGRIDANLSRMQTLLENLLSVAEIIDRLDPCVPQAVNLPEVLHTAVDRARPQLREKQVTVLLDADAPLPPASADPAAVQQIVDSLLAYSAARSAQGGDVLASARLVADADDQRALMVSLRDFGSNPLGGAVGFVQLAELDAAQPSLAVVEVLAARQGGRAWAEVGANGVHLNVRLPVAKAA